MITFVRDRQVPSQDHLNVHQPSLECLHDLIFISKEVAEQSQVEQEVD